MKKKIKISTCPSPGGLCGIALDGAPICEYLFPHVAERLQEFENAGFSLYLQEIRATGTGLSFIKIQRVRSRIYTTEEVEVHGEHLKHIMAWWHAHIAKSPDREIRYGVKKHS